VPKGGIQGKSQYHHLESAPSRPPPMTDPDPYLVNVRATVVFAPSIDPENCAAYIWGQRRR
jgi:hypothetical protein